VILVARALRLAVTGTLRLSGQHVPPLPWRDRRAVLGPAAEGDPAAQVRRPHIRESPASVNILVGADSHYISPEDVEAFLCTMEAAIVGATLDQVVPTGMSNSAQLSLAGS
jgi:hypothetical protein